MRRDEIYIAAILHDIGKFIERSKEYKIEDRFNKVNKGHPKYSAQFFSVLHKSNTYFNNFSNEVLDAILYHHEPKNDLQEILQLADWLSSSEREKDEKNTAMYYKTPLESIFSKLFKEDILDDNNYFYQLKPLSLDNLFPGKDVKVNKDTYRKSVKNFLEEIKKVTDDTQLYFLLEKYLWSVPAQTWKHIPDISLFDHSKTTAAIALCLYDQYQNGYLNKKDLKEKDKSIKKQFLLINGDISGIQNFIFNVSSKRAAKSLKGRSVYINIISEIVSRYILDKLKLKRANLLYNGGGNFYILAPFYTKDKLIEIRKKILRKLLKAHKGEIYFAIDYITLSPADFKIFSQQWDKVKKEVNKLKQYKWKELDLNKDFQNIFGPFDNGSRVGHYCNVCGVSETEFRLINKKDEDGQEEKTCSLCNSFINLTDELKNANYLVIEPVENRECSFLDNYNDILNMFGYNVHFLEKIVEVHKKFLQNENGLNKNIELFKLNSTDFLNDNCSGFKFGAYKLPMGKNNGYSKSEQLSFDDLAKESIGDKKLGILKLDVDNLGVIFNKGLKENKSISRVTALSRMFGLYFEGYINKLVEENGWGDKIYVVFSGGDDTFIVGSWDKVLDFTAEFYKRFRRYTCFNEKITFSAGLGIYDYKYPIIRAVNLTEEALDNAKYYLEQGQVISEKNKVSLFGEVFNWEEFERIRNIKDLLIKLVNTAKEKEGYGHAILYKVKKSTLGFKKILENSNKGMFKNLKFWNLAYYLRKIKRDFDEKKIKEDYAESLIDEYRKIVIYNLMEKSIEKKINNIMIIPAAVRWAELETRILVKED